jgi:hypothetical protein
MNVFFMMIIKKMNEIHWFNQSLTFNFEEFEIFDWINILLVSKSHYNICQQQLISYLQNNFLVISQLYKKQYLIRIYADNKICEIIGKCRWIIGCLYRSKLNSHDFLKEKYLHDHSNLLVSITETSKQLHISSHISDVLLRMLAKCYSVYFNCTIMAVPRVMLKSVGYYDDDKVYKFKACLIHANKYKSYNIDQNSFNNYAIVIRCRSRFFVKNHDFLWKSAGDEIKFMIGEYNNKLDQYINPGYVATEKDLISAYIDESLVPIKFEGCHEMDIKRNFIDK